MILYYIFALIVGGIVGLWVGIIITGIKNRRLNKKLEKEALATIRGERENTTEIEGKQIEVNKFILELDKGKEIKLQFGDPEYGRTTI